MTFQSFSHVMRAFPGGVGDAPPRWDFDRAASVARTCPRVVPTCKLPDSRLRVFT